MRSIHANRKLVHKSLGLSTIAELPPSYNVAPTQQVLVARDHDGKREGVAMRWGLIPWWAKDAKMAQINARSETAAVARWWNCNDGHEPERNNAVSGLLP